MTVEEAYARCAAQARTHYENFPVGSRLLPAAKRKHIHAVYAFARTSDDFADETYGLLSVPQRLELLDRWERQLDLCLEGKSSEPIFAAVREAIRACGLPVQLFRDLLSAFKQDVVKDRYANFGEVLDYCRRSANPVGRLVLHIFDYRDEALHRMSDSICTGLQLANFWQDVRVDILKNRIYLPEDEMARFGVAPAQIAANAFDGRFRELLRFQVNRTWDIFHAGRELPNRLAAGLRLEIKLTWLGGTGILRKIEDLDYNTLQTRPTLSKLDFLRLLARALLEAW